MLQKEKNLLFSSYSIFKKAFTDFIVEYLSEAITSNLSDKQYV